MPASPSPCPRLPRGRARPRAVPRRCWRGPSGRCACRPSALLGADRVAERAVEAARVLCRVGQDLHLVVAAASSALRIAPTRPSIMSEGAITSAAGSASAVACRVRMPTLASLRMRPSAVISPSWAMARVGIERGVRDDADLGDSLLDGADGAAHQVVAVHSLAADGIAEFTLDIGKGRDGGDAEARRALRFAAGLRRC